MSAVKIGVIGLGQRGLQHLNSLCKIEDAEVVALCDPTAENLVEDKIAHYVDGFRMGNIKTYTDFSDFFSSSMIDPCIFPVPLRSTQEKYFERRSEAFTSLLKNR